MNELMGWSGPVTHRQFKVWCEWSREQWNQPDRSDYYSMQVSLEVRRVLTTKKNLHKLDHMKIRFKFNEPLSALDLAEHDKRVLGVWMGRVGGRVRVRQPDGSLVYMDELGETS